MTAGSTRATASCSGNTPDVRACIGMATEGAPVGTGDATPVGISVGASGAVGAAAGNGARVGTTRATRVSIVGIGDAGGAQPATSRRSTAALKLRPDMSASLQARRGGVFAFQ